MDYAREYISLMIFPSLEISVYFNSIYGDDIAAKFAHATTAPASSFFNWEQQCNFHLIWIPMEKALVKRDQADQAFTMARSPGSSGGH